MIRREWEKQNPDPYVACHNKVTGNPRYHQCENCEHNTTCDIGIAEYGRQELDDIVKLMRNSDIKYKATYYQNELGFWHCDEQFDKVPKHDFLKGTTPRFDCFNGSASHPHFWQCDKCVELYDCEIGQYRMKMKEEKEKAAKEKAGRLARAITDFFKKFF